MKILVVPTIRETSIKQFLQEWDAVKDWDKVILVEDNPVRTFDVSVDHHYSWHEIEEDLGSDAWIISRRDSAIRSYGFYKAWQMGASHIFTLDDDCLPVSGVRLCKEHIANLEETPKWTESIPGFRTRGLPYKNLGLLDNVVFSIGLWEGVPDLDAIHMLAGHKKFNLPETRLMPKGQYFPFCGMNFAFKKEVAPLTYFPLMGQLSPFGRFDDIWFGVICKKICDHLNLAIACGKPYIYHSKASDPLTNLVKEAPGIKYNETFWEFVESAVIKSSNPTECILEMGHHLEKVGQADQYLHNLGKALQIWGNLFS